MKSVFVMMLLLPLVGLAAPAPKTLDDQVAAYKAAGEPIEPADFNSKGTPDADNAAVELRAAGAALKSDTDPAWVAYQKLAFGYPLTDAQAAVLRTMVDAQAAALPHIDAAMARPAVDWQIKFVSPVMMTLLPHLKEQRMLAKVLQVQALLAHRDGNDAEAIKDLQRLIFISRAVDHQPFIVTHLVSLGCMELAAQTVEWIAPDLKIGPAPATSAQEVQQLIAALLDDAPSRQAFGMAMFAERMSVLDITRNVVAGKINGMKLAVIDPPAPPLGAKSAERMQADGLIALQYSDAVRRAFDASSDLPGYKSQQPKRPPEIDANPKEHQLARNLTAPPALHITRHYRTTADRRLAAVALAMRAYAVAHNGKMPTQLDQLVPQYLPKVPVDPMTSGQPFTYLADKSLIYSVGVDGADDAGSEELAAGQKPQPHPDRWQQRDAVMHLVHGSTP
jgi:hypothetical protein